MRLARASGYGAGIASPGWYGHLFSVPDRPVERWLTKVARLLRDEDRIVSSAHVIEAVRLADTLAVMRGRPLPGLTETTDAVRSVLCEGSDVPLSLVHDKLVVGDVLGEVPESAPAVPLQRDLTRLQRKLRLKPEALERELELDLRKETDAARSRLLHRLRLLGIGWGEPHGVAGEHGYVPGDLAVAVGAGAFRAGGGGGGVGDDGPGRGDREGRGRGGGGGGACRCHLACRAVSAGGVAGCVARGDAGACGSGGVGCGCREPCAGVACVGSGPPLWGCAGYGDGCVGFRGCGAC